jgi:lipoate-protein ligase A
MTTRNTIWRLLQDGITDPYRHFAVEEAILRGVDAGSSLPTLRLRQVDSSVFLGVFQRSDVEVDLKACRKHGIAVVRRSNPGGAVYQDAGSFCYTITSSKAFFHRQLGIDHPQDLYPLLGRAVSAVCASFGVLAAVSPVNDVTIGGRKVYGSAQVEFYSALSHSGTFLVKSNMDMMEKVLHPPELKFAGKSSSSVRERVVNLCDAVGHDLSVEDVMLRLARELGGVLGVTMQPGPLTEREKAEAAALYSGKYSRHEWNNGSSPVMMSTLSTKAISGIVTLHITLSEDVIDECAITGDFLLSDPGRISTCERLLRGLRLNDAVTAISRAGLPEDITSALIGLLQESIGTGDLHVR